ncbi:MAG: hypothetical protein N3A69_12555, partial [Leptospiraceae bacterium]|nr:hypothetical protein [Leptospiraceae bacterium]
MNWKKINRKFQNTNSLTRKEAFVLARFHEESPEGNPAKAPQLFYSVLTGKYPSQLEKEEIAELIKTQFPLETAIQRLSLWKLYEYLSKKKLLDTTQKLQLLDKFQNEYDPIVLNAWKEKFQILEQTKEYEKILSFFKTPSESEKKILGLASIQFIRSKAIYYHLQDFKSSREIIYEILKTSHDYESKRKSFELLKKILGTSPFEKMTHDELALGFSFLSKKEKEYVWKNILINPHFILPKSAERIAKYIVTKEPNRILEYLHNQNHLVKDKEEFFCYLGDELLYSKKEKLSLQIVQTYLK